MDNHKFAFIICKNNELQYNECIYYLSRIALPDGFAAEILAIEDAPSMCAGYNEGMGATDAKYKIYLHQDVFITNERFLQDILALFQAHPDVGMVGMIGGTAIPETGVAYRAWNVGKVDCREPDLAYYMHGAVDMPQGDTIVEAVDGLLIATQYDIPWREDLFKHFDFYDVSQSFEMRKAGYSILVPAQDKPWVIHDSNFAKLDNYDDARKIAMREYPDFFYADGGFEFVYDAEWNQLSDELADRICGMIDEKQWGLVSDMIASYRGAGRKSSRLERLGVLSDLYEQERKTGLGATGFVNTARDYSDLDRKYAILRYGLRRLELGMESVPQSVLAEYLRFGYVNAETLQIMILHGSVNKKKVSELLSAYMKKEGKRSDARCMEQFCGIIRNRETPITYAQRNSRG